MRPPPAPPRRSRPDDAPGRAPLPEPAPLPTARLQRDDENVTQVRQVDDVATVYFRPGAEPAPRAAAMDALYESLPSLEMPAVDYDESSSDPRTTPRESCTAAPAARQLVMRESGKQLRDEVHEEDQGPPTAALVESPARHASIHDEAPAHVDYEERSPSGRALSNLVADESYPSESTPEPAPVPNGFVMGVQPLRQPTAPVAPVASPSARAYSSTPMYTPAISMAPPPAASMPSMSAHPMMHPAGMAMPVQQTLAGAEQRSKLGRFAWFVFGAAFGIIFAFIATGFAPHLGKKDEATATAPATSAVATPARIVPATTAAPPAATIAEPAPMQPPVVAPVVAPPPIAPVLTAPVAVQPAFVPATPVAPPTGVFGASPVAAPVVAAPAPVAPARAPRTAPAPRREEAPAPARPAPAKEAKSEGAGDLLSAGLAP